MKSALLVPMHVDCLWVDSTLNVNDTFADFTALPWPTAARDIHPDAPFLAEAILDPPFQGRQLTLRAGLHLHWSLPAALSGKYHGKAGANANQWARAPNRWLVSRFRNKVLEQEWVVESDFLHPLGTGQQAIAYPVDAADAQQPFRQLGRQQVLSDWAGNADGFEAIERLTAVGYGEPAFAGWYPACHSVFGFHDGAVGPADHLQLRYDVLGWYHDPVQDPLADIADTTELASRLQWSVPIDEQTESLPRRSICFGRSRMVASAANTGAGTTRVAVARTGSEALSALLAEQLGSNAAEQSRLEDQLESVSLAPLLEHHQLDIGPKFREARHEKGFVAVPAGQRWSVRPEREAGGASPHGNEPRLPAAMALLLEQANHAQQAHDDALQTLDGLRAQLYADWCKYQRCLYPPDDARESYPDADELRDFIEQVDLASLKQWRDLTGELQLASDPEGRLVDARSIADSKNSPTASTASRLAAPLRALIDALELFSKTGFSGRLNGARSIIGNPAPAAAAPAAIAPPGYALEFDGHSNWLAPDHCIDAPAPTYRRGSAVPALTVSVWLRSTRGGTIASWDAQAYWAWSVDANGRVIFSSTGGDDSHHDLTGNKVVTDGQWHHIAIRFNALDSSKAIWIDGELDVKSEAHQRWPLGNGKTRRGSIGAMVPQADDQTSPAAPKALFAGELSQFRLLAEALSDQRMTDLQSAPLVAGVALRPIPAPRYWEPREPVVLVNGPAVAQRAVRRPAGPLACAVSRDPALATFDTAVGLEFAAVAAALRAKIDALSPAADAEETGFANNDGTQFEPILMEWQAEVWPLQQGFHEHAADGRYSPDYIISSHRFSAGHVDLEPIPGSGRVDAAAEVVSGRCILSGHAGTGLREQLVGLLADPDAQARYPDLVRALARLQGDDGHVLSQALGGFNAALLQRHQVLQLPIKDPLGFDDQQPFTDAVAGAVGQANSHGALPKNAFMPITAGAMRLLRLQLLDRFGRTQELDLSRIASPRIDQIPGSDHLLRMPPRISQPARIDMRWLSAHDGLDEMNDHIGSSPICGWLLPNNLDDRVAVYDARLQPLGRLGPDARGIWHPAVGADHAVAPRAVGNPRLRRLLEWLLRQPATFFQSSASRTGFRELLEDAQESVCPANASQHTGLALLLGNPVAVVRLRLALKLQGPPVVNQDWNVLRRNMQHARHDDSGFTAVRLPVLLGAPAQFNDGLLGYWIEDDSAALGSQYIAAVGADPILLVPNGPPITVTALIDPRCALHATSGVLPVKSIDLPPDQYAKALANIGAGFLTAPLLTAIGKLNLPLRDQPGYRWSWLAREDNGNGWQQFPRSALGPISRDARFSGSQEIREGWLQLHPTTEDDSA